MLLRAAVDSLPAEVGSLPAVVGSSRCGRGGGTVCVAK